MILSDIIINKKKMQILNEITYNLNNNIIPDNKDKQLITLYFMQKNTN